MVFPFPGSALICFFIINANFLKTWDLFENNHMFNTEDKKKEDSSLYYLAEMIALLSPPLIDFVRRSEAASDYFDAQG